MDEITNTSPQPLEFEGFPKLFRLSRECVITEKLDGTNAQVYISPEGEILAGSRTRWIYPGNDNYGFAAWVAANKTELLKLGPGRHFGEWWGSGVQRGYGLTKGDKRFSLFNASIWGSPEVRPKCCDIVPVMYQGIFTSQVVEECLERLRTEGSLAVPGFMKPEGVVIYHVAGGWLAKKTCEKDESPKSLAKKGE